MAKTTKTGKKKRLLTAKQINLQLKTWSKNYQPKFHEIIMQAEQRGVLDTDTNTITDKDKKLFREFSEFYTRYYGSYTNFLEHEKAKYVEQKISGTTDAKSFKSWFDERRSYSELIDELFDTFTSTIAYEEYLYLKTLPRNEARERLKKNLENGWINDIDYYEEVNGSLKPKWEK